jgi:hypothetical protein
MISTSTYMMEIPGCEWVSEVIGEIFDGALELLVPGSVVYGGAVRDVLAGKELVGDLDIAVSNRVAGELSTAFDCHSMWLREQQSPSDMARMKSKYGGPDIPGLLPSPIQAVNQYKNPSGKSVQLVVSSQPSIEDAEEEAIHMARVVDLTCCGLIMRPDGTTFEVIPSAYDHCRQGILMPNRTSMELKVESLKERVDKLTARGWQLKFDVKAEQARVKKARKEFERQRALEQRAAQKRMRPPLRRAFPSKPMSVATGRLSKMTEIRKSDNLMMYSFTSDHMKAQRIAFDTVKVSVNPPATTHVTEFYLTLEDSKQMFKDLKRHEAKTVVRHFMKKGKIR